MRPMNRNDLREVIALSVYNKYRIRCCMNTVDYICANNTPAANQCRDDADAILSALDAAGMVVVPKEPTEVMIAAGVKANDAYATEIGPCSAFRSLDCYRAMIAVEDA